MPHAFYGGLQSSSLFSYKENNIVQCMYNNLIVHFAGNKKESFNKRCNLSYLDLYKQKQNNKVGK